ncbi:hypothetical protein [Citreimonas salinaria]
MTAKLIVLSIALASGAATLAQAETQPRNCAPRDTVIERLAAKYGETRKSIGLGKNAVMEVFASAATGTWTITLTTTGGLTCLVASGQAFENMADVLPPQGEAV